MSSTLWSSGETPWWPRRPAPPRIRVIIDNDFAGDPDDLYQLAHHLLSPSVEVPLISCSRLPDGDPLLGGRRDSTEAAEEIVAELLDVMRLDFRGELRRGSPDRLRSRTEPHRSPAAAAIIAEAMRTDTDLPLFLVLGGGLTELASAWLLEPRIAARLTVVWIGGCLPAGVATADESAQVEYNFSIDPVAAQVVFNDSDLSLWQVPREVYRQCLVSEAELLRSASGPLGRHLHDSLDRIRPWAAEHVTGGTSESYALGDSPLVLLTALQSFFEPDPSSSDYLTLPCPALDDRGRPAPTPEPGRTIRVYTRVDTRLMLADLFTKMDLFDTWLARQA